MRNRQSKRGYWIGLQSPWANSPFYHEDNSAVDYTNWAPGKPGYVVGVYILQVLSVFKLIIFLKYFVFL